MKNIAVIAFNRPEKLRSTLLALPLSRVTVFIDGPRNFSDVKLIDECISLCDRLGVDYIARSTNLGLANNIIFSMNHMFQKFDFAICVEDDVRVFAGGIEFLDRCATKHRYDTDVFQIGLYQPLNITQFGFIKVPRICSWGWGCWRDRWESIDWGLRRYSLNQVRHLKFQPDMVQMIINQVEGRYSAWVARADFNRALIEANVIYPSVSLSSNHGADGTGVNTPLSSRYDVNEIIVDKKILSSLVDFELDFGHLESDFNSFYKASFKSFLRIFLRRLGI